MNFAKPEHYKLQNTGQLKKENIWEKKRNEIKANRKTKKKNKNCEKEK